ncbi:hypothetical protein [Thermobrachium celere]|uniref:Uncharacterized protein n=1 Tax=Thermobrachium celere DSM 8682 TaxID=941824 RepID=R7RSC0_9CLOT|nr:hypothetical protein [Thermobrachium celere]CDF58286.1 hypothetical protein TCEL_00332 [Thermobrachium celere DSM 8682]
MKNISVWCADIGSIKANKFGWCKKDLLEQNVILGKDIKQFALGIADDLTKGYKVALGFECPLFIPISENPLNLTSARNGEKNRAWSASAGSQVLSIGLAEMVWIFKNIKENCKNEIKITFDWNRFINEDINLFIWEAFVSGQSKTSLHENDAQKALDKFCYLCLSKKIEETADITAENPFNLAACALMRANISKEINLLSENCLVVKV